MGIGVLGLGLVVLVLNSFLTSPTPILMAGFRFVSFMLTLDLFVTLTNFVRSDKETFLSSADLAEPLGSMVIRGNCALATGFTSQGILRSLQSPPGSVPDRCSIV